MKSVVYYLSIICVIFAFGCDNASKQDTTQGQKTDTAELVNDSSSKRRYISVGTAPAGWGVFRCRFCNC